MDVGAADKTKSIYLTATTMKPDEQAAYLRAACGSDSDLLRRITALLAAARTTSSAPSLAPSIDGYCVLDLLGRGGMGSVWRAVQLGTRRRVALKVLPLDWAASERAQRRFAREVELAARLEHPNIARIYDAALHEGKFYYAMELVAGLPLDEFARAHALDARQVIGLMRRVCRPVEYAHARGIIHRDLKPSNILVTPDAQPHVLDFGLAKSLLAGADSPSQAHTLTLSGEVSGTPGYMSPEQASGATELVDTRSDVYALGAILYRMLTGDFPIEVGQDYADFARRLTCDDPRPPAALRPGLDAELEAILLRAVARDPERRYASVLAFHDDLTAHLAGRPTSVRPPDPFGLRQVGGGGGGAARDLWRRRLHRAAGSAIALASLAALVGATFGMNRSGSALQPALRLGLALLVYGGVAFPVALRAVSSAARRGGAFAPRDVRRRTFAAFLPACACVALFWSRGDGSGASVTAGMVAGALLSAGLVLALFRPSGPLVVPWLARTAAALAIGLPAHAAALWIADALAVFVLPAGR